MKTEIKILVEEDDVIHSERRLSKKQVRGLLKLAKIWGKSPEDALAELLDQCIEKSL